MQITQSVDTLRVRGVTLKDWARGFLFNSSKHGESYDFLLTVSTQYSTLRGCFWKKRCNKQTWVVFALFFFNIVFVCWWERTTGSVKAVLLNVLSDRTDFNELCNAARYQYKSYSNLYSCLLASCQDFVFLLSRVHFQNGRWTIYWTHFFFFKKKKQTLLNSKSPLKISEEPQL